MTSGPEVIIVQGGPQGPQGPQGATGPAPNSSASSTTSLAIGTGSKVLTVQSGRQFYVGTFVLIARTATPDTHWMHGVVSAYSGTTLTVEVTSTLGTGTYNAWSIAASGPVGPQGTVAVAGNGTATTASRSDHNHDATYLPFGGVWHLPSIVQDFTDSTTLDTGDGKQTVANTTIAVGAGTWTVQAEFSALFSRLVNTGNVVLQPLVNGVITSPKNTPYSNGASVFLKRSITIQGVTTGSHTVGLRFRGDGTASTTFIFAIEISMFRWRTA